MVSGKERGLLFPIVLYIRRKDGSEEALENAARELLFSRRLKWAITGGLFYNCQLHNALGAETSCGRMRLSLRWSSPAFVGVGVLGFVVNDGWGDLYAGDCFGRGSVARASWMEKSEGEANCGVGGAAGRRSDCCPLPATM